MKKKTNSSASEQDAEADDGFQNHENFSPDQSRTSSFNDSSRKFFRPDSRDSMMSPTSVDTATKLKSIMLHKVDEE